MVSVRPIQKSNDWMMKFEVLMMADIAVAVHVAEITMILLIRFIFHLAVRLFNPGKLRESCKILLPGYSENSD